MYRFLQDSGEVDNRFVQLWSLKIPLKVKTFVWLVLRRRILTRDILLKRGWSGPTNCVYCLSPVETADHLFVTCASAKTLLEGLMFNKLEVRHCSAVDGLWEVSALKQGALGKRALTTIAATWWAIWLERNGRVFDNKKRNLGVLLADIRLSREDWTAFCV